MTRRADDSYQVAALLNEVPADKLRLVQTPKKAVKELERLYSHSVDQVRSRFEEFCETGTLSDLSANPVYPYACILIPPTKSTRTSKLMLGRSSHHEVSGSSISHPALFRRYLEGQFQRVVDHFDAQIYIGLSRTPIPLPFVYEATGANLSQEYKSNLQSYFPAPNLLATNDDIVDGNLILKRQGPSPLTFFTAERVDYSLHRLRHYSGTNAEYFQNFILFTNYQRYVDEFKEHGLAQVKAGKALSFVEPGNRLTTKGKPCQEPELQKLPQMPSYHLTDKDHNGVTLINIGVGPSNAKTITDHLAVLRPHVWLMIGHCGGLRLTQRLGDYVLAHAYVREDGVLDDVLPLSVPIPTIAEVQQAMTKAVMEVSNVEKDRVKEHLRTGTVVTTSDRNWELRFEANAVSLNKARAIAIDMESATIAANGYRFRVPYGTLLCVSDRPLHGELKLPGMADAFYEERVSQHLEIGLRAIELLRNEAKQGTLHSRKLRSFDEPFFR